jgi:hypothetical protein
MGDRLGSLCGCEQVRSKCIENTSVGLWGLAVSRVCTSQLRRIRIAYGLGTWVRTHDVWVL